MVLVVVTLAQPPVSSKARTWSDDPFLEFRLLLHKVQATSEGKLIEVGVHLWDAYTKLVKSSYVSVFYCTASDYCYESTQVSSGRGLLLTI